VAFEDIRMTGSADGDSDRCGVERAFVAGALTSSELAQQDGVSGSLCVRGQAVLS